MQRKKKTPFRTEAFFYVLRGTSESRASETEMYSSQDYKVILPPLPSGVVALDTVFFHADVTARSYRVEDFHAGFDATGLLKDVLAIGCWQFNHVWIVILNSLAAKHRTLQLSKLTVKVLPCRRPK